MPQNAKQTHRPEISANKTTSSVLSSALTGMGSAQTEEQRVAAMFKIGADQWAQQQLDMAK